MDTFNEKFFEEKSGGFAEAVQTFDAFRILPPPPLLPHIPNNLNLPFPQRKPDPAMPSVPPVAVP